MTKQCRPNFFMLCTVFPFNQRLLDVFLDCYTIYPYYDNLMHFRIWFVGCFGFNGPLRQYFSLYRAVFHREGERGEKRIDESKNVQTTPTTRTYNKRSRPLPYCNPNCRTPRHWKFTQHHRTTRPTPVHFRTKSVIILVSFFQ